MNDLDPCLEVLSRSRQPLRYIWRWISRKPLEIEVWFTRTTNRKWHRAELEPGQPTRPGSYWPGDPLTRPDLNEYANTTAVIFCDFMNIFELLSCCFKTYFPLLTLYTILSTFIAFHYATHYCTEWNQMSVLRLVGYVSCCTTCGRKSLHEGGFE